MNEKVTEKRKIRIRGQTRNTPAKIVTLVLCGLFSISAGAAEPTAIDCRKPDVVMPHSTVSDLGISKGLGVQLGHQLRHMYCTAQRIVAEPALERRLADEDIRQGATRSSEDLMAQLQPLATAEAQPSFMAFTRAFRAFRDLNVTISF